MDWVLDDIRELLFMLNIHEHAQDTCSGYMLRKYLLNSDFD